MTLQELIRACAKGNDDAAWEMFVSRFHRPISLSIIRTAYQWGEIPQQVVDDLVQETFLKLCADRCRLLLEFADRHPEAIVGYVKTMAINVARDHFKSLHSQKRGAGLVTQIEDDTCLKYPMNKPGGQTAIERDVLITQIKEYLESRMPNPDHERDCTIFWLYYQQGMTANDIAAVPEIRLSAKGVEGVIFRLTRQIREELVGKKTASGTRS
jgi:RNA polymerase sigma-70 factor, ECF subfamily